jgi:thiamine biosynthesis protein ThiS
MSKTNPPQSAGSFEIRVNGEPRAAREGMTIDDLLVELRITTGKVAVERNREIAPRSRFSAITLSPGDEIEILRFVGGG